MNTDITGRHMAVYRHLRLLSAGEFACLERSLGGAALSASGQGLRERVENVVEATGHARGQGVLHTAGRGPTRPFAATQVVGRPDQRAGTLTARWKDRRRR